MRRIFTYIAVIAFTALPIPMSLAQIPERVLPPKPLYRQADTVTISFIGDVMMHQGQIDNALQGDGTYSFSTYFKEVDGLLSGSDLTVANMEFTLAGPPYTGYPSFSAPEEYADHAWRSGIDVFLTANNHILDKSRRGILKTLERYDEMEESGRIKYTGCAADADSDMKHNPLLLAVKGIRIALINFTYGTNQDLECEYPLVHRIDTAWIGSAIRRAKAAQVDYIVALPHWGTEYVLTHSASQRKLALWLAQQGCDAIIGSHPHVLQDMECLHVGNESGIGMKEVPVAYSLGNMVSNMSAPNTRIGMVLKMRIATDCHGNHELLPLEPVLTWCTRPGTLTHSYCVIPVKDYLCRKDLWIAPYDHDNMVDNYERVKSITNIAD